MLSLLLNLIIIVNNISTISGKGTTDMSTYQNEDTTPNPMLNGDISFCKTGKYVEEQPLSPFSYSINTYSANLLSSIFHLLLAIHLVSGNMVG